MKALNKGNILGVRKYQEGGTSPVSQMPMRQAQQIDLPSSNKSLISSSFGGYKPQSLEDLTTSQLWEQVTGTPWSEAAKRGHTSGKFNDREENIALRQVLTGNDPIGTLDYIEKESDKAIKQEEATNPVPVPASPVKSWEGTPSPRVLAKPGDQSFIRKTTPEPAPSQAIQTQEEVNTNPADTTTLPDRYPSAHLSLGPATGGGFNWSGAGIIGGGALIIGGSAFHKPIGKMIAARVQKLKAAKAAKTVPAAVETPETVVEGSAPVTETAPVVAAKEPVVAPAENTPASATTPTEVVKPATTPTKTSTVSKTASGNVSKAPANTNVKEAKLVRRPGTVPVEAPVVTPKEAPAYFENNNTSGITSLQQTAESIGKPITGPVPAPKATVETSIKNRNGTTKAKSNTPAPKKAPANIKGKNSTEPTSFQETAQEVGKPQEATAPENVVKTSIKNRTAKTGTAPKEAQPSLFDEVGKVAETVGEGVGKVAETVKVVGKSGALKGIGKVAGRANMFGMILDPALQIVRAFHYKYSSPKDYDGHYGAGAWDADHKATEEENRRIRSTNPMDKALPGEGMDRRMEMNRNGGKLNSLSGDRLLIQK